LRDEIVGCDKRGKDLATASSTSNLRVIHPVHAVLLASILPLFLGGLLSDWAYFRSYQLQWSNFASWLNAGALLFAGAALVWAAIDLFGADVARSSRNALYLLVLLTTFVLGFINALVHAKDAWAVMPAGLILSILVFLLALASVWLGFSGQRGSEAR
jgi:uncharacterized membrane protein